MNVLKLFVLIAALVILGDAITQSASAYIPGGQNTQSYLEPYSKHIAITADTGTWVAASNNINVFEIRVKVGGRIRCKAVDQSTYQDVWLTDFDMLRLRATQILLDSTTADTILALGYPLR